MGRPGPCILGPLVSLMAAAAGAGGEICHSWTEGVESPAGALHCPELVTLDGDGASFCCGTCSAPYCCSLAEARLEQEQCPGGPQRLLPSVPPSTHHDPYSFYIGVGLTAATLLGILGYLIYLKICLPLRTRVQARQQVHQQDVPPSRVSFQDPSPNFVYSLGTRLVGPPLPIMYNAFTSLHLASPPSQADVPGPSSQEDSGLPGEDVAGSPPAAAVLDTAASGRTPEPEERTMLLG